MKDKSTNRPWKLNKTHGMTEIKGGDDIICAIHTDALGEKYENNARMIVHRVNTYEELVGALKVCLECMNRCDERQHIKRHTGAKYLVEQALLNAEKESV